mmetsp:Transcript_117635/g.344461  ORF Transcript_117635/g.344461 Transcript_117635/m.344461 type:complete len:496 (+) Transcript_117635:110-1597(+)
MAGAPPPGASPAAAADVDFQAVDGIPRETLVTLLKRKNKDAKTVQTKLDKLEERYVKVVRFNKILMEDRTSFQRFCNELIPESDGTFEEAAAQESPVNFDALLRPLTAWRSAFDAAKEDRRVFQQFIELVFPGDEAVLQVFERTSLGSEAFDVLQQRWVALEDLHNQSIASVNSMSREQMLEGTRKLDAANAARQEAERKVEEMREQLTQMAREKAQMLKQRLQGGGAESAADASSAAPVDTSVAVGVPSGITARELEEVREALRAAERRLREVQDSSERRERELLDEAEAQRSQVRQLQRELDGLREEGERYRTQARQLLEEKDALVERLQRRIKELDEEVSGNAFITQCAEQQAGRDAEVKAKQREMDQLNQSLLEIQKLLGMSYEQERALKARIRELESSRGRGHTAGDYLKHVVLKYVQYTQSGDLKAQTLVPVLCTLLNLSPEECRSIETPALPQSLLLINQAVGGASSWLRGSTSDGDIRSPGLSPQPQ